MKFNEKLQKISDKGHMRMDRLSIILGVSLLVVSCISFFVFEAYGQQDLVKFECPKNAYYGFDNQGNQACRDIQTNEILETESVIIIDSNSEKTTETDSWIITNPETGEIILNDTGAPIVEISILALIGIVGGIIGVNAKKRKFDILQRHGWSSFQKEQVRSRQYEKCNMCFTPASHWKYDYIDGNKNNNELNNCQALCRDCYSIKTERDNRVSIYQKSY